MQKGTRKSKIRVHAAAACLCLLFATGAAAPAGAAVQGGYWGGYHWAPDSLPLTVSDHTSSSGWAKALRFAIDQWSGARAPGLKLVYARGSGACSPTPAAIPVCKKPIRSLGETFYTTRENTLTAGVVSVTTRPVAQSLMNATATHELGHALGIFGGSQGDHNPDPASVMYYRGSPERQRPTAEDLAALRQSYGGPGPGAPAPPPIGAASPAPAARPSSCLFTLSLPFGTACLPR